MFLCAPPIGSLIISSSRKKKGILATKIYSDSYSKDPSFYEFFRKLDAYDKIIDGKSIIFLPIDSDLLNLLKDKD